jgi:hypothetical protein
MKMNWVQRLFRFHLIAWQDEWKFQKVRTSRYKNLYDLKCPIDLNMSLHLGIPLGGHELKD